MAKLLVIAGDLLCFLHADTHPPKSLVNIVKGVMAQPQTVLGGFRTIIQTDGKQLRGMTLHHLVKTYYIAALVRPLSFLRYGTAGIEPFSHCCIMCIISKTPV